MGWCLHQHPPDTELVPSLTYDDSSSNRPLASVRVARDTLALSYTSVALCYALSDAQRRAFVVQAERICEATAGIVIRELAPEEVRVAQGGTHMFRWQTIHKRARQRLHCRQKLRDFVLLACSVTCVGLATRTPASAVLCADLIQGTRTAVHQGLCPSASLRRRYNQPAALATLHGSPPPTLRRMFVQLPRAAAVSS